MKLTHTSGAKIHLGYCSNIHAGESWQQVRSNLQQFIPTIHQALAPDDEFGIGLRLSAVAVAELADPGTLREFMEFLTTNRLYVFTVNGFPYGPFHGTRVKQDVYLPDWQNVERLRYTNQLADVFAHILPVDQVGSISTVPGAFKASVSTAQDVRAMTNNMVLHVAHLAQLEQTTGKCINLALEPEPCCFLETIDESVAFFTDHLFGPESVAQLSRTMATTDSQAEILLRKHLTLCLDLCHAAVEYEDPSACLAKLEGAGITVGKMQISSGLRLENVTPTKAELLKPFDDNIYLHQVVERCNGTLNRFSDLDDAFSSLTKRADGLEWRVHFHVPIFIEHLSGFSTTQNFVADMLARHKETPISNHLEVETYTWDVLPEALRTQSVAQAIVRELRWVLDKLA